MTDTFGNELNVGDNLILTVSRGSQYLTSAQILEINEDEGKVKIMYVSTIATKWIDPSVNTLKYTPKPFKLDGRLGLCRDCVNQIIEPGQRVAYRNRVIGADPICFGTIKSVDSDLWATLDNDEKIRNNGIFVL